jgi:hypothetical protein
MTEKERLALESLAQELARHHWLRANIVSRENIYLFKEILERHLQSPFA